MLRKVLKHDLSRIYLPWLIMSITVLVFSVVAGFAIRTLMVEASFDEYSPNMPLCIIIIILAVIAVAVYSVAPYLIVLYRYYQNFFTDEGYLTFTLPVKRYTLFNSKLLTALIFNVSTALVVFVSFLIAFGIAPELNDGSGTMLTPVFKVIGDIFELFFMFGNGWAVGYIILGVLIYIMSSVFSSLLVYACVTIGCIVAQKMKILVAVLVFYLANTVISIFSYIGTLLMELFTVALNGLALSETQGALLLTLALLAVLMILAVICTATYSLTLSRLEKNLNLA